MSKWLANIATLVAIALASLVPAAVAMNSIELAGTLPNGAVAVLRPESGRIVVGEPAQWTLLLVDHNGLPFEPLSVAFEGRMPEHGHGFPHPATVRPLPPPGEYAIRPVLFNMSGFWQLVLWIGTGEAMHQLVLDLSVAASQQSRDNPSGADVFGDLDLIRSLSLAALPVDVGDSSNRHSGNPTAIELGRRLFFDLGMSGTGSIACATCHQPERAFTDGKATSRGTRPMTRNAPTLIGTRHATWFYWDGRRDSLWAQAVTPLETVGEMDNTRTAVVRYVAGHPEYRRAFARLSGSSIDLADEARFPSVAGPFAVGQGGQRWSAMTPEDRHRVNEVFTSIGKVLAAYIETLEPEPTRFDRFAAELNRGNVSAANDLLTEEEVAGLRLFLDMDRTHCLRCHNGPLLTNQGFHAIGSEANFLDLGRQFGLPAAQLDPFNCTGRYSDSRDDCAIAQMAGVEPKMLAGTFKVPTLRYLGETAPYFHDGRFDTLEEVVEFYGKASDKPLGAHELPQMTLSQMEMASLVAFLKALSP